MKKLLSIFMALLCAGFMFAETVELVFNTAEGLEALGVTPAVVEEGAAQGSGVDFTTAIVGNLEFTADKGSGSKAPNVYTNKDQSTEFRVYKGNTLTFTAKNETDIITEIVFDGTGLKFADVTDKKWSGKKHSVTINTTEDTGTRTVRKITVTLTEGEEGGEGGEGGEVKPKVALEWTKGVALREEGQWKLTFADTQSDDHIDLVFKSDKNNSIAGSHTLEAGSELVYGGETDALASGTLKLTFKQVEIDDNVYAVEAAVVGEKSEFTITKDIRIFAWDGIDPILLAADRPFVPQEGQLVTCAQARDYAQFLGSGNSGVSVTVEGYITDLFSDKKSFWIDDTPGSTKTFEVYQLSSLSPADVTLAKGMKVRATGVVQNYNGTPEIKNGSVVALVEVAIDNTSASAPAVKFIENGQLYILRDGVRYNVQGQIVK